MRTLLVLLATSHGGRREGPSSRSQRSAHGHALSPCLSGGNDSPPSPPRPPGSTRRRSVPEQLRGKVVLIDFWTYTCINWRRTVPYLRAWVERFGSRGCCWSACTPPSSPFEHDLDNVRQQVKEIGVGYPVAVDNDFAIWRAFGNEYWPALYVFDSRGRLRHQVFGEEGYEEADRIIRKLLEEAGQRDSDSKPTVVDAKGFEKAGGLEDSSLRRELRRPPANRELRLARRDQARGESILRCPRAPRPQCLGPLRNVDHLQRSGGGRRSRRKDSPTDSTRRDSPPGHGPGDAWKGDSLPRAAGREGAGRLARLDVDQDGVGTLREQRMYQLIRQPGRSPIASSRSSSSSQAQRPLPSPSGEIFHTPAPLAPPLPGPDPERRRLLVVRRLQGPRRKEWVFQELGERLPGRGSVPSGALRPGRGKGSPPRAPVS
jgi:hypothetical protein